METFALILYDNLGWNQKTNVREARIGYGYVAATYTKVYTNPFTNGRAAYSLDVIRGNTSRDHFLFLILQTAHSRANTGVV